MTAAKPYTLPEFIAECGPGRCDPDFDRLRATVEALAASQAEVEALRKNLEWLQRAEVEPPKKGKS